MKKNLDVHFLPAALNPKNLVDRVVVVVDVLRATTTITASLNAGASCIIPCPSIDSARRLHRQLGDESVMGGERKGIKVDGFQCGNSPLEYTPEIINNKTLILATTNGTVAMEKCRLARRILIGAFVNLEAVASATQADQKIAVLCSGTDGYITGEDVLYAGAFVERLRHMDPDIEIDDGAHAALNHWLAIRNRIESDSMDLASFMRTARGGKNLVRIGHDKDIVFCSRINSIPIVPVLDARVWKIQTVD